MPPSTPTQPPVYQLKVTLKGLRPPIWRRLVVPGEFTLERLHAILQDALGWTDSHLHKYSIKGKEYGTPDDDLELPFDGNERLVSLRDVVAEGDTFAYEYDFGDGWEHTILVEKLLDPDPSNGFPSCLGGARACPPEDCGGPPGYDKLLRALAKPRKSREEAELVNWAGPFDPERFDLEEVNRLLREQFYANDRP